MRKKTPVMEWKDDYCGSESEKRKKGKVSQIQVEEHHLVLGLKSESLFRCTIYILS